MLVSTELEHRVFFGGVRAIVVDEVHAFAGDDRGWHLLAVLERLTHLVGRPIQRVGLSATVGNPAELLVWLQGSGAGTRTAQLREAPGRRPVRPIRCRKEATVGGPLIWMTRSRSPTSMPSSNVEVATMTQSRASLNARSALRRSSGRSSAHGPIRRGKTKKSTGWSPSVRYFCQETVFSGE